MTDTQQSPKSSARRPKSGRAQIRKRKSVMAKANFALFIVLLLMCLALGKTLLDRMTFKEVLAVRSQASATLHVRVTHPESAAKLGPEFLKLKLPGTLQGVSEAQIYARANGYVSKWFKDIGDPVKQGESLAILDIPEVDKQVEEAQANYNLARTAYTRWAKLREQDAVSQQELDEKTGAYRQTEAVLKRLKEQVGFAQVVAPFDGIVTKRNVNQGDLVNAGNGGNTSLPLFSMARIDKLHMYVFLPQDRAGDIKVGDSIDLFKSNAPDTPIKGRIARTAGAIDTSTRTLQVEVEVANDSKQLMPGTYVDVVINLTPGNALVLPTNALLFTPAGPQVAVVQDNKVIRKDVKLGVDYGDLVQVKAGVGKDDQVIINPPDSVASGQAVIIETPPTPKAKPSK